MCGINGIFQLSSGGTHLKDAVSAMNAQLAHRGPDDNGIWIDDTHGLALGQTRLSILDLSSAGHQPMHDSEAKNTIVFNGDGPNNYLPVTNLEHDKLIYPKFKSLELHLKTNQDVDYQSGLIRMLNQFEKREIENWRPTNIYQLKSVLSQVLLIPCLYFSTIHNDRIFKRESFNKVKDNFTELEWKPIACATNIRTNWDYSLTSFQRLLMGLSGRLNRKIVTRFFTPKIPIAIQEKLNDEFYENLKLLVKKIKEDIV